MRAKEFYLDRYCENKRADQRAARKSKSVLKNRRQGGTAEGRRRHDTAAATRSRLTPEGREGKAMKCR